MILLSFPILAKKKSFMTSTITSLVLHLQHAPLITCPLCLLLLLSTLSKAPNWWLISPWLKLRMAFGAWETTLDLVLTDLDRLSLNSFGIKLASASGPFLMNSTVILLTSEESTNHISSSSQRKTVSLVPISIDQFPYKTVHWKLSLKFLLPDCSHLFLSLFTQTKLALSKGVAFRRILSTLLRSFRLVTKDGFLLWHWNWTSEKLLTLLNGQHWMLYCKQKISPQGGGSGFRIFWPLVRRLSFSMASPLNG